MKSSNTILHYNIDGFFGTKGIENLDNIWMFELFQRLNLWLGKVLTQPKNMEIPWLLDIAFLRDLPRKFVLLPQLCALANLLHGKRFLRRKINSILETHIYRKLHVPTHDQPSIDSLARKRIISERKNSYVAPIPNLLVLRIFFICHPELD